MKFFKFLNKITLMDFYVSAYSLNSKFFYILDNPFPNCLFNIFK